MLTSHLNDGVNTSELRNHTKALPGWRSPSHLADRRQVQHTLGSPPRRAAGNRRPELGVEIEGSLNQHFARDGLGERIHRGFDTFEIVTELAGEVPLDAFSLDRLARTDHADSRRRRDDRWHGDADGLPRPVHVR